MSTKAEFSSMTALELIYMKKRTTISSWPPLADQSKVSHLLSEFPLLLCARC